MAPVGKLNDFVTEIAEHYTKDDKCGFKDFSEVRDYDGTTNIDIIYRLEVGSLLTEEVYNFFLEAVANPEEEGDPLSQKVQAYVIQGDIVIGDEEVNVKLISMQKPITMLKHRFWYSNNAFNEIEGKFLSLRPTIDVVIIDKVIYFLSMAGENLFNLERAYKAICIEKAALLEQSGILYDTDNFVLAAQSSHHPRMFVSFNQERYQRLLKDKERKYYAKMFDIPLKNGKFDMSQPEAADKLVKLLCNKGMVDPFENLPVEVSGAKKWQ